MSWKNLKIGKKLGAGFGVILALFIAASANNWASFGSIEDNIGVSSNAGDNKVLMVEKVVDHLNWTMKLQSLFASDDVHEVLVQTDDHKCGLGKWLYGEETQALANSDPELGRLLKEIEAPHKHLHESAINIGLTYVDFDLALQNMISERWIDHLSWTERLANSVLSKEPFDGGLDPEQCPFGQWYHAYKAENPEFANLLHEWEGPHRRLHESARKIVDAQKAGNYSDAASIFAAETNPTLDELQMAYQHTSSWMGQMAKSQTNAQAIFANETQQHLQTVEGKLAALTEYFNNEAANASTEMHADISSSNMLMIIFAIAGVLIGIFAAFIITRGIAGPVSKMASVAESISTGDIDHSIDLDSKDEIGLLAVSFRNLIDYMKGLAGAAESIANNDLTVHVEPKSSKDILGNSFKTMTHNLTGMVRQLRDNATQLVTAATEISSASEQMAKGATDQSQQVNQVSAAVEEMSATILESSRNSGEATEASRTASDTATNGGEIVSNTIAGMQRINDVVRESADSIAKLATSADQIGEIVSVIDDIADQTNLLALNAAIEAARAGEQGRGFAVVADEVRKLAERTGKATGEITDMIKGIQQETGDAVQSMEAGVQEVDKGRDLADQAGNSLSEVVAMSARVMDMIQQIATASEEQSVAAEQISKNIEHINSVTKETAAGAEQSAAAAEELNRQAEGMQEMVARFNISNES